MVDTQRVKILDNDFAASISSGGGQNLGTRNEHPLNGLRLQKDNTQSTFGALPP